MTAESIVLVEPLRTPFGLYKGSLEGANARDLAGFLLTDLVERSGVDPTTIDEVIGGWALADSYAPNIARVAALDVDGVPEGITGVQTSTGIEALEYAASKIKAGEGSLYIVFGVESTSSTRNALPKTTIKSDILGPRTLIDPLWEYRIDAQMGIPLGALANLAGSTFKISREDSDVYAARSHKKAFVAAKKYFKDELTRPYEYSDSPIYDGMPTPGTVTKVAKDEGIRMGVKASSLASSSPLDAYGMQTDTFSLAADSFTVTADNSAMYADGAAGFILTTATRAKELGLTPIATLANTTAIGTKPGNGLLAPGYSLERLLTDSKLSAAGIDRLELDELFATQLLGTQRYLEQQGFAFDLDTINVNGGSIALGDAFAATSLRQIVSLARELERSDTSLGASSSMTPGGVGRSVLLRRD